MLNIHRATELTTEYVGAAAGTFAIEQCPPMDPWAASYAAISKTAVLDSSVLGSQRAPNKNEKSRR